MLAVSLPTNQLTVGQFADCIFKPHV